MNDIEKRTDSIAQQVKVLYNEKNVNKIYAFTNEQFKSVIKLETWQNVLQKQLFPHGNIIQLILEKSKDSTNVYKAITTSGMVFNMSITIDADKKIAGLLLRPYEAPAKEKGKRKNYYHDNALQTNIDSLVHKYASQFMETSLSPGLAIGILIGTKSYFYNYGNTIRDEEIHPTKQTVFEIGSITKTFTTFLLADAAIENKIKLTDPISNYLPDSVAINPDLQKITLEQLANHSSGLPRLPLDLFAGIKDKNNPYAEYNDQRLFSYLKHFKAERKAGEKYEYSNLGIGLLGVILERINKMPLEKQYQQIIFQPLKMKNTYSTGIKDSSMTAVGYDENGKPINYWDFNALAGAGSIKSTTEDLINYSIPFALMPRIKGKYDERIVLLQKITFKEDAARISLGWNFDTTDSEHFTMQKTGGTGGFRSMIAINPSKKLAVVALNNYAGDPNSINVVTELMTTISASIK